MFLSPLQECLVSGHVHSLHFIESSHGYTVHAYCACLEEICMLHSEPTIYCKQIILIFEPFAKMQQLDQLSQPMPIVGPIQI